MASLRGFYPPGFENLGRARRAVVNFAMSCGFFDAELAELETAVGEALNHCADPRRERTTSIDVQATFAEREFTLEVRYGGEAFGAPAEARTGEAGAIRGLSVSIMRKLVDRVEFYEGGRRIRLVKHVRASLAGPDSLERA